MAHQQPPEFCRRLFHEDLIPPFYYSLFIWIFLSRPSSALLRHLLQYPATKQHFDQTLLKFDEDIPVHLEFFKPQFFLLVHTMYSPKKFDFKYIQTTNGLRLTNREEDKVHRATQEKRKEQQRDSV